MRKRLYVGEVGLDTDPFTGVSVSKIETSSDSWTFESPPDGRQRRDVMNGSDVAAAAAAPCGQSDARSRTGEEGEGDPPGPASGPAEAGHHQNHHGCHGNHRHRQVPAFGVRLRREGGVTAVNRCSTQTSTLNSHQLIHPSTCSGETFRSRFFPGIFAVSEFTDELRILI